MLPYVEEALLDKRYENKIEEIREIKDLGEYAMGISGQAEKLVAMNEHLARENSRLAHENVALRRILERK